MPTTSSAPAPVIIKSPFRIFTPFSEADREAFFGRKAETDLIYQFIHESNIVLVYGESGTGKTSLVRCGLLNEVKHDSWTHISIRREKDINASLIEALKPHVPEEYRQDSVTGLLDEIFLDKFQPILLIFDQFEELFIFGQEEERKLLLQTLKKIMQLRITYKIVVVIREDYLAWIKEFEEGIPNGLKSLAPADRAAKGFEEGVPRLFTKQMRVAPMDRDICERMITDSCRYFNIEMAAGVPGAILDAAFPEKTSIRLPYLQVFLDQMWKRAPSTNSIKSFDADLVTTVGALGNILKVFLEEQIAAQEYLSRVDAWKFLKLFVPEKGTVRKRVKIAEYTSLTQETLTAIAQYFVDTNILSHCASDELELAHECLVSVIQNVKLAELRTRLTKPTIHDNPYQGLKSFDIADSNRYFGRREAVDAVYEKVQTNNLIVIVGNSGSGKSSLIKAGLFPRLQQENYYLMPIIKAGEQPLEKLQAAVAAMGKDKQHNKFILLIDQYEELITRIGDKDTRQAVYNKIFELATQPTGWYELKIFVTVRADFEPQFSVTVPLIDLWKQGKYIIPPFSREEIMEVIEEPAYQAGLEFNPPSLVETIADEVYGSQATGLLPLMSFTLSELYKAYEKGPKDHLLKEDDYKALGGVLGGLQNRADYIYRQLQEEYPADYQGYKDVMRIIILRMVYMSTGELAGQRVKAEDLVFSTEPIPPAKEFKYDYNAIRKVLMQKLTESSLIIAGPDPKQPEYYEPAHDVLVKTWGKIWDWIGKLGKDTLFLRARLTDAVNDYFSKGEESRLLWTSSFWLDQVSELIKEDSSWLNEREHIFLTRSLIERASKEEAIKREQEEKDKLQEDKIKQLKRFRLIMLTGTAGLLVLLYFFIQKNYEADKNFQQATVANTEINKLNDSLQQKALALRDSAILINKLKDSALQYGLTQSSLKTIAESQRKRAESLNRSLKVQIAETKKAKDFAELQAKYAQQQKQRVDQINDQLITSNKSLQDALDSARLQRAQSASYLTAIARSEINKDFVKAYRVAELAVVRYPNDSGAKALFDQLDRRPNYIYTRQFSGDFSTWSSNGQYLLTSSSARQQIILRNNGTFAAIDSIESKPNLLSLSFSTNGQFILMTYRDHIEISRTSKLRDPDNPTYSQTNISQASFSNDPAASRIMVIADGKIHVLNNLVGKDPVRAWTVAPSVSDPFLSAVFSPDSRNMIALTRTGVYIYDAIAGKEIDRVTNNVQSAFISPAGNYYIVTTPKGIDMYAINGDRTGPSSLSNYGKLNSVTFSKDGTKAVLLFGSFSAQQQQVQQQVQKGDLYANRSSAVLVDLTQKDGRVIDLNNFFGADNLASFASNPPKMLIDGDFLLFSQPNGLIRLRRLSDGATAQTMSLAGHEAAITSISMLNSGGTIMTSSSDDQTKIWTYATAADLQAKSLLPKLTTDDLSKLGVNLEKR